jgi:tetratricopeptide (TPR) repeat protein
LGEEDAAFDAYYKAVCSEDYKAKAYLKLAQISCRRKQYSTALEFARESLYAGWRNFKARNLLIIINRIRGDIDLSREIAAETLSIDPLDFIANYETARTDRADKNSLNEFWRILRDDPCNYIFLAAGYAELGLYDEAITIIKRYITTVDHPYVLSFYYLAFWLERNGSAGAEAAWKDAANADSSYCFPNTIEDW